MRLKIPAGVSGPLLASCVATLVAGCPTGVAQQDSANPPKVVGVYASDINLSLPDVALYLDGDSRVSATAPASYGVIKVEFDQPLSGTTTASLESLNSSSACAPIAGGGAIKLINDALLFLSACEQGAILVSMNSRDMDLLLRFRPEAHVLLFRPAEVLVSRGR